MKQEAPRGGEWRDLKEELVCLAHRMFPRLCAVALEMETAGLVARQIPRLFARDLLELDPSLNEDLLDLFGWSEQLLANQFSFLGETKKFGREIDWECEAGSAWRGELHAFHYALALGLAYRISREERYARHLRYLIADWVASNPPFGGRGWKLQPLARRVRNWILSVSLAREDWERDTEFLDLAGRSLALQSAYLAESSHFALSAVEALDCARALNLAGLTFGGTRGSEFRSMAHGLLRRELDEQVLADGGHRDGQPGLQGHLAATVMEFLLFEPSPEATDFLTEKLRRILGFLEAILLPDGTLPLFGCAAVSSADSPADVMALAAVWLREPRWKSLAGQFGILPYMLLGEEGKKLFENLPREAWKACDSVLTESGFYRLTGKDSSAAVIAARSPSSPTGHQDFLSYELSIRSQRVIVDSGAFSSEGDGSDDVFRSAAAHNVLLIDEKASGAALADFQPPGSNVRERAPGLTGLRLPDSGFAVMGLKRQRGWYCLDGQYWVVLDWLEGCGSPRVVSVVHFFPVFEIEITPDHAIARSRASAITLIPLGQAGTRMKVSRGSQGEFPGWYAPVLGVQYEASVLALEWDGIQLPWVGGYLIALGDDAIGRVHSSCTATGIITVEISGKQYRLPPKA